MVEDLEATVVWLTEKLDDAEAQIAELERVLTTEIEARVAVERELQELRLHPVGVPS